MAFSYLHANVIDIVGTTIITINIKGGLIKTHVEFIKKNCFLRLENFSMKAKIDYDKGNFDWTIELSIATKVTTIPTFDVPMVDVPMVAFLPQNTIHGFSRHMFQPFATTTIAFVVIGVCGEIDSKFELLVTDGSNLEDIQIVSFWKSRFKKNIVFSFFQLELMVHLFSCRWVLLPHFMLSSMIWHNSLPTFCIVKNIACSNKGDVFMLTIVSSIIVPVLSASLQKNLKEVYNLHIKLDCTINHKVSFIIFFFIVF